MASDFTIIQAVRQRFGDGPPTQFEVYFENDAPFVGRAKDFPFSCPNIDLKAMGLLQFESLGVTAGGITNYGNARNILQINGNDIPGGITPGPAIEDLSEKYPLIPIWKSHSLIVPQYVLREENVLHIEAVKMAIAIEETYDTFIIDNIVVFFKTNAQGHGRGGEVVSSGTLKS